MRNAECGMKKISNRSLVSSGTAIGINYPHSAFRTPHSRCFSEEVEWLNQFLKVFSNSPG